MSDSVYDRTDINATYDRSRALPHGTIELWMETLRLALPPAPVERIIDGGSRTGRFSQGLADGFGAEVIGIEPSVKMLATAREKHHPRVRNHAAVPS